MQNLTEQQIREIVRDEMNKSYFRLPKLPPHKHDGVDNINIDKQNLIGNKINSGVITFEEIKVYSIGVNFVPNSITFYGQAVNSISSPTVRAMCVGNALVNGAFYESASTSSSTVIAPTIQNIAQSCVSMIIDNSGTHAQGHVYTNQDYLMDVYDGTTHLAKMHISSTSSKGVSVSVDALSSGWVIEGNFVIL